MQTQLRIEVNVELVLVQMRRTCKHRFLRVFGAQAKEIKLPM